MTRAQRLYKAMNVPPQRQYPVLLGYACARRGVADGARHRCQRGGCQFDATFARVWLSPVEIGRFTLTGLRHGVYYCSEHAHEAHETTGVPVLEDFEAMKAYQVAVIEDSAQGATTEAPCVTLDTSAAPKVIVARGINGVIFRHPDETLEFLPNNGDPVFVCCRRKARSLAGEADPVGSWREHSRDCATNARNA